MLLQPTNSADSILGYTLREKIGSGGYGEVWVAEAPGGLTKAVKLIFGFHDESRAQRELKALNRIKQVRHPFLLSLERIDIVDGRLVVVTELAEQSLKDRFRQRAGEGEVGIPRDELLGYLSDAAEALDYIYESHSLLHLDVKPENLLLVGGHVKLADFGLVKDIQETSLSLMGGLTPLYAAPEVFDGKPGSRSDQYSLAIVFQEMLTGKRPFSGSTPAKLALQHLHEPPDLSYLSPGDQGAIRRALAKAPDARFVNCRAFVDELLRCRSRPRRRKSDSQQATNVQTPVDTFSNTVATPMGGITSMAQSLGEKKLAPLELAIEDAKFRPTLFIGIGQTATAVLRHLKRRLQERLGDEEQRPAVRILCLDTDTRGLAQATTDSATDRLDHQEILPLPLKSPSEYREGAEGHFNWLSRRWIYNIPRSRQTEGLRPLGRLAFVDHHDKVFDRLHTIIGQMTESEAVSRTAQLCEMSVGDTSPRVFVVASISGGAGSGMVADVAYTVRMVLAERGLDDFPVHGVLLYSTGAIATRRDITVANTYCCLSELYHYSHSRGYPGDPSCDLPPFEDCPTFENTYLIDMGSDPLADEYTAMADVLAEYLFLNATSPCGEYFSACREENLLINDGMYLRTLGVSHTGNVDGDAVTVSARAVGHKLLRRWLKSAEELLNMEEHDDAIARVTADAGLDTADLITRVRETIKPRLECDLRDLIQKSLEPDKLAQSHKLSSDGCPDLVHALEDTVDNALGISRHRTAGTFSVCVKSVAESVSEEIAQQIGSQIYAQVLGQLDRAGPRIGLTELFQQNVVKHVDQVLDRVDSQKLATREQLSQLIQTIEAHDLRHDASPALEEHDQSRLSDLIRQYGDIRLEEFLYANVGRVVGRVRSQLDQLALEVVSVRQDLSRAVDQIEVPSTRDERNRLPGMPSPHAVVSSLYLESTMNDIDDLVNQLDRTLQLQYFEPNGGFCGSDEDRRGEWGADLWQVLYRHARSLVAARIQIADLDLLLDKHRVPDEQISKWVEGSLKLANPNLMTSCGGQSRLVVAIPRGSQGKKLQSALEAHDAGHAKLLPVTDGDIAFCYDVGGIPIHQVAAVLLQSCPRSADIISRVHTRTDINWTPLIQLD